MTDRVARLAELTGCSFSITWNEHRLMYEPAEEYHRDREDFPDVDWAADVWTVHVYERTPVAFLRLVGNDLDALLDALLEEMGP